MLTEGKICIASIPQSDGKRKQRPVLLLKRRQLFNDWLVCGISSNIELQVDGYNYIIDNAHKDFIKSGLEKPSVVRLNHLAVLPKDRLLKSIGSIGKESYESIFKDLIKNSNPKISKFESLPD